MGASTRGPDVVVPGAAGQPVESPGGGKTVRSGRIRLVWRASECLRTSRAADVTMGRSRRLFLNLVPTAELSES
jgi:hypothetical protein